jgi:hypothetical protein
MQSENVFTKGFVLQVFEFSLSVILLIVAVAVSSPKLAEPSGLQLGWFASAGRVSPTGLSVRREQDAVNEPLNRADMKPHC